MPGARQVHNTAGVQSVQDQDEITAVEPLRVRSSQARNEEAQTNGTQAHSQEADSMESQQGPFGRSNAVADIVTDFVAEHGSPERELSRSGSTKTDSFLKDGGVETRKISLTPNILREDSDNPKLKSVDSKEVSGSSAAASIIVSILTPPTLSLQPDNSSPKDHWRPSKSPVTQRFPLIPRIPRRRKRKGRLECSACLRDGRGRAKLAKRTISRTS